LEYMKGRRWFRGKAREPWRSQIQDMIPMSFSGQTAYLVLIEVEYREGEPETYVVPLSTAASDKAGEIENEYPHALVTYLKPSRADLEGRGNATSAFVKLPC
jgi:maltose alpha-D-glucosyltransferase/alpha-amylase